MVFRYGEPAVGPPSFLKCVGGVWASAGSVDILKLVTSTSPKKRLIQSLRRIVQRRHFDAPTGSGDKRGCYEHA